MSNFPGQLDNYSVVASGSTVLSSTMNGVIGAVNNIEAALGTYGSSTTNFPTYASPKAAIGTINGQMSCYLAQTFV